MLLDKFIIKNLNIINYILEMNCSLFLCLCANDYSGTYWFIIKNSTKMITLKSQMLGYGNINMNI